MKKTIALIALIIAGLNSQAQTVGPWDLDRLSQVPKWKETETASEPGMKGILYESIPYKENPVEVFAYYSAPKGHVPEGGWPAVVCVHGGGGTAFNEWIQKWNDHGFAAISMDLEGHIQLKSIENGKNTRISTPNPGPKRDGIFKNYALPLEQQWYYHAVAQTILANSLIRSFPEVNSNKIGITGISWGGTLTSTIMGVDKRFKFAIPVYGCGFIPGSDGNQGVAIKEGQHYEIVNKYWDGSAYFGNVTIPTFWVNGTNDKHFPMPSIQKSSQALKAPATLRIQLRMKHGHHPGWEPEEIYVFANSVVRGGDQLLRFDKPQRSGTQASVSFTFNGKMKEAELLYTKESGIWPARNWEKTSASISGNSISATIPEGTTTLFFNATDERELMVSSEYIQIKTNQDDKYWIVLDVNNTEEVEGELNWEFQLNCRGRYNVQILSKGGQLSHFPEVSLESGGTQITEAPRKIFVLDNERDKQTVFQFTRDLSFNEKGVYSFKIDADSLIDKVRIIPHYRHKTSFSTGKYDQQWLEMHNSPDKQAAMTRLKENKYGMFIHWGLYSQAGGIWKGTRIEDSPYPGPRVAEWLMSTFQIPRDEYALLAETFNPEKSFASEIASLAKAAGMKYVVITSKHHDGFALFDSQCSDYDIVDRTPYKADAIKELYDACLNEGLNFGVYYSHGNDWYNGTDGNHATLKKRNDSLGILSHIQGKNHWDPSPDTFTEYLENKAYPQIRELLSLMPELFLIWFDGDGNITEEQAFKFYKIIYDINPNIIVNRRVGYDFGDYLDAGDNVIPTASDKLAKHWETCGTTNNSWGFKSYDNDWKNRSELLYYLVDIASKGGNYLLNIGPDGKGHVPESSANGLREVGQWLKINGEAIYGTERWLTPFEGQDETPLSGTGFRAAKGFNRDFTNNDFWFTSKNQTVYAISLVPAGDAVTIRSLKKEAGTINKVRLLGSDRKINWVQTDSELQIDFKGKESLQNGYALEVVLE